MGTAADARVAADHANVAGEPADHARQPAGDAREPDSKRYSLRMNALASSKTLASLPARAEIALTVRMLLKLIVVTALASPTSAFRTSQKLVGRAFGASAGKNQCESSAFCSP